MPNAHVGCRALVPFNNRKVTGYILEKMPRNQDENLKEILEILDTESLFHSQLIPFFEWIAEYYIHPIGKVIQSVLPGGMNTDPYNTAFLTEKGLSVCKALSSHSEERQILSWIKDHPGRRLPWPTHRISGLEKRGWLILKPRRGKGHPGPLMRKFVRVKEGVDLRSIILEEGGESRTKNEVEFLESILSSNENLLSELVTRFPNGSYLVGKWIKKGILESFKAPVYRNPAGNIMFPYSIPEKLYAQQDRALRYIRNSLDKRTFSPCLLYGVTGSGKTEVYFKAAEYTFDSGRQVILVVPEISLAVYMEGIFRSRLGNRVAIYHSGLSRGERYDQWMRMARGDVDLVIGARSALFAPLPSVGLIVVDEEHDSAYKQESSPHYQARDAAVVRAKMENAVVILGSGTPSVQSFQNSMIKKYHLLLMKDRVEKRPMPDVEVVDMKTVVEKKFKNEIFSPRLKQAIDQNLTAGNQTILFLNRRGFHRMYLCRSCGQNIRCPNCDVALTYHLKEDRLICHYCGFCAEAQTKCPSCGNEGLRVYGFGTEKLEQEIKGFFPDSRVARMDADSTRKKGQAFRILKKFGRQEIDILVGTQIITKGYDFPFVTLVGVIAADFSLGFPDFRAGERTFQILSQVTGRAGRGNQRGRVIIQTFNPDHYAISTAMAYDYKTFFSRERELRKQLGYPPFSRLACLKLKGNSKRKTAAAAQRLGLAIKDILTKWPEKGKQIQLLGPSEAPISRLKGKYRWQILIKSRNVSLLQKLLNEIERSSRRMLQSDGVHLILDVDPYQMT